MGHQSQPNRNDTKKTLKKPPELQPADPFGFAVVRKDARATRLSGDVAAEAAASVGSASGPPVRQLRTKPGDADAGGVVGHGDAPGPNGGGGGGVAASAAAAFVVAAAAGVPAPEPGGRGKPSRCRTMEFIKTVDHSRWNHRRISRPPKNSAYLPSARHSVWKTCIRHQATPLDQRIARHGVG